MTGRDVGKMAVGPSSIRVGKVEQVVDGKFRLQTERGEDLWLTEDCVFTVDDLQVTLICEKTNISHYAVAPPAEQACA